ncbi:hypothetical protein D8682_19710 [Buttiauxella sp. 3AFRM03]|uniref:HGGxSTG domain-containing protein n=1 Tax=Buttiauxella sp. 3AFRM03 TaxID=2479367 RepID=UPI000EF82B65|nr:HGGxSTG domain-containing protein [Buttiauxella sp. 3AFRM03]AYN29013.1 hypothetical protein D8682_19710 [Buttiauxella sp. 3AFRM03]
MDKELKRKLADMRKQAEEHRHQQDQNRQRSSEQWSAYYSVPPRFRPLSPPKPYQQWVPYPEHLLGISCGATTRAGTPCKLTIIYSNGRCKYHGGMSTGAKTKAGIKRQREGYRKWLERQRASKAGRKRSRVYAGDVPCIDLHTLTAMLNSEPGVIPVPEHVSLSGFEIERHGPERFTVTSLAGICAPLELAATHPARGGLRWWFVCPQCHTRRTALYVTPAALICRQCAGLHYASQGSKQV